MRIFKMTKQEYLNSSEEYEGRCVACGATKWDSCEPDAENYECEECGELEVFGIEQLLMMGLIQFEVKNHE